jgi:iron(III) transport system permease protein
LSAGAIRNSLVLSLLAVVLSMAVGLVIARSLVRGRGWGKPVLDGLVMLPLAVPGIVMAFGMIALSMTWPFNAGVLRPYTDILGATPNPFPFLVLAYAVRRLPYVVRAAVAGLEQTPAELEEAGAMCGARKATVTRRIVLPLVAANLVAGALLAFSFAMLEVSDSILLAQRESDYPVTKAIYALAERLGDGQAIASALGVWAMALLAATLLGASLVLGKRLGAVFRA